MFKGGMMFFGNARAHFLEFLRNLTPQILLFSIAAILGSKLDIDKFDLRNTFGSLPFLVVMSTFFAAAFANITMFIEKSCTSITCIDEEAKRLKADGVKGCCYWKGLFAMVWQNNKIFFVEIVLAFIVVQVGFSVVLVSSMPAAINIYKVIHPNQ